MSLSRQKKYPLPPPPSSTAGAAALGANDQSNTDSAAIKIGSRATNSKKPFLAEACSAKKGRHGGGNRHVV
jgi:hypothetical protein